MAAYSSMTLGQGRDALKPYGLTIAALAALEGGAANSSFVATTEEDEELVITVLDNHDARSASLLADLTDWLIENDVTTPPIVKDLDGHAVSRFEGKPFVVRPRIKGTQPTHLSGAEAERVGIALAHLHALEPPTKLSLPGRRLPSDWREQLGASAPGDLTAALEVAGHAFTRAETDGTSLIHGDLFPDNLIWTDAGELYLLDWETASLDWAPLDIGFTAVGLAADDLLLPGPRTGLVSGYTRDANEGAVDLLPLVTLYACAVLMFHRYMRHAVRFPDPAREHSWAGLMPLFRSMADELS